MDIDHAPLERLSSLGPIIDRHHATRFVVIASERRDEWVQQAMHAGARDYIVKSAVTEVLAATLDRIVGTAGTNGVLERVVISVLSAGGGCGATTVAINLARELAVLRGAPALLVDLDAHYGSLAAYLGLSPEYGVADVLDDGSRPARRPARP